MTQSVDASPAKEFFIRMITRDIALDDCILDLIDNSVDGAKRTLEARGDDVRSDGAYQGFGINLQFDKDQFRIEDNCGGIDKEEAKNYAFHFGRRLSSERQTEDSIGIYGIGMKRAIFKIGRDITVKSQTGVEAFDVEIDVNSWELSDEWTFPMHMRDSTESIGTTVIIDQIYPGVAADLADIAFVNDLTSTIAQDYSIFIRRGLTIRINDRTVPEYIFSFQQGENFEPAKVEYRDQTAEGDIVEIEIAAGMAASPPDDTDDELARLKIKDVDGYGWFVLCNDRVVLSGDKSERTVWGDNDFQRWHPQYNGFLGIVQFHSKNPAALPWTTTKRDVDDSDPIYRQAITRMKELTSPFIEYTNARKVNPEEARALEQKTEPISVTALAQKPSMKLPSIAKPRHVMRNVSYRQREDRLFAAASALGDRSMSFKDIGLKTFDYYYVREVEE